MTTDNSYEAAKIANPIPNDGEWWMVATEVGDIRVMRYWLRDGDEDAVWNVYKDESMSVLPVSGVTPMYKMDKLSENQAALEEKPSEKVDWVNGDKCIYNDGEFTFVSYMCNPEEDYVVIWRPIDGVEVVYKTQISKPETKQQREDRERLEAAYDLLCIGNRALNVTAPCTLVEFKLDKPQRDFWLAIVDKTNYRKGVK